VATLAASFGVTNADMARLCTAFADVQVLRIGELLILESRMKELRADLQNRLASLHHKSLESRGFSASELKSGGLVDLPDAIFDFVLQSMLAEGVVVQEGPLLHEPERHMILTPAQQELNELVHRELRNGAFAPPSAAAISETLHRARPEVEKSLVLLERLGRARRLGLDLFFDVEAFDRAVQTIENALKSSPELSVSDASRLLSSSRKYVVPFLEYLDSKGITERAGNVRVRGRSFA